MINTTQLTAEVAETVGKIQSAAVLIRGIRQAVKDAVAAAVAKALADAGIVSAAVEAAAQTAIDGEFSKLHDARVEISAALDANAAPDTAPPDTPPTV